MNSANANRPAKPRPSNKAKLKRKSVLKKMTSTKKTPRLKTGANGRPSDYRPEYADQAYELCLAGYIDIQLAEYFELSIPTVHNWRKRYPEFFNACRLGKAIADGNVTHSLYLRSIGMKTTEVHVSMHNGRPVITEYQKEHLPDVNACRYWLKNRQPDHWKENVGITDGQGGAFGIVINEFLKPPGEARA